MRRENGHMQRVMGNNRSSSISRITRQSFLIMLAVVMTIIFIPVNTAWADSSAPDYQGIVSSNKDAIGSNNTKRNSLKETEIKTQLNQNLAITKSNGSFSSDSGSVEISDDVENQSIVLTVKTSTETKTLTLGYSGDSVTSVNERNLESWVTNVNSLKDLGDAVIKLDIPANNQEIIAYNDAVDSYMKAADDEQISQSPSGLSYNEMYRMFTDVNDVIQKYNSIANAGNKDSLNLLPVPAFMTLQPLESIPYTYHVEYKPNAGNDAVTNFPRSWTVTTPVKTYGNGVAAAIPKREGYTFLGWSTKPDGKVEYQHSGTGTKISLTRENPSLTLYAVWAKQGQLSVTYKDGVDGKVFQDIKYEGLAKDSYTPAFSWIPVRDGYTFIGWSPSISTKVTENAVYTAQWKKTESGGSGSSTVITVPKGSHLVTFHLQNGQSDLNQAVVDGGWPVEPSASRLTRAGYTLEGWSLDAAGTQMYDFMTPVTSDMDLYAQWKVVNKPVNPLTPASNDVLLPCVRSSGKTSQMLTWTKVNKADGYDIYFAKCDTAYHVYPLKKVASVKAAQARVYKKTGLTFGVPYKYSVKAYRIVNGKKKVVRSSISVHSIAGNSNARYTNVKAVKAAKTKYTIKKGKTVQLKVVLTPIRSGRQLLSIGHCAKIRYISNNTPIATVSTSGRIKARKTGTAKVYILGSNGIRAAVTVKVVK